MLILITEIKSVQQREDECDGLCYMPDREMSPEFNVGVINRTKNRECQRI